jgi:hypothetical protein
MVLARPCSASRSHSLLPAPSRIGPRHSPCSGRVLSQWLRALAAPGRCRCPGCSVQRYVSVCSGLQSPVPNCSVVCSSLRLQAPGHWALMSIHIYQRWRSASQKVQRHYGTAVVGLAHNAASGPACSSMAHGPRNGIQSSGTETNVP